MDGGSHEDGKSMESEPTRGPYGGALAKIPTNARDHGAQSTGPDSDLESTIRRLAAERGERCRVEGRRVRFTEPERMKSTAYTASAKYKHSPAKGRGEKTG